MFKVRDAQFNFQCSKFKVGYGEDCEKPVHTVHMQKSFAIGLYQVTFDEYDIYAKVTGRSLPADNGWGRRRRPVINVAWEEVAAYCEWLSGQTGKTYRLPTEAEWEYGARSGGIVENWSGTSREEELRDFAWYDINSEGKTQDVGVKRPNRYGLYDMSGNVWEWVEDCWHENYNDAPTDGSAWLKNGDGEWDQRVVRGGSWRSVAVDCDRRSGAGALPAPATTVSAFVLPGNLRIAAARSKRSNRLKMREARR